MLLQKVAGLQWNRLNMTLSFSVIYDIKALKPD